MQEFYEENCKSSLKGSLRRPKYHGIKKKHTHIGRESSSQINIVIQF